MSASPNAAPPVTGDAGPYNQWWIMSEYILRPEGITILVDDKRSFSAKSTRRRTRIVSPVHLVRSMVCSGLAIMACHGGGVCNSYTYAAVTDGAVGVRVAARVYSVILVTLPANKVTLAGVGDRAWGSCGRDCWDGRRTAGYRSKAQLELICHEKARCELNFPEIFQGELE
jgi:hypothetical protein